MSELSTNENKALTVFVRKYANNVEDIIIQKEYEDNIRKIKFPLIERKEVIQMLGALRDEKKGKKPLLMNEPIGTKHIYGFWDKRKEFNADFSKRVPTGTKYIVLNASNNRSMNFDASEIDGLIKKIAMAV